MLSLLLTRRWLAWLLVAALAATACVFLGRWQYGRYEHKITAEKRLDRNYNGTPIPLRQATEGADTPPTPDQQWRQVRLVGDYLPNSQVLVRNRPLDKTYGYEVIVPMRTTEGDVVFVDRGWIPNGRTAAAPDSIPPTPSGRLTVIGWLKRGEPNLDRAGVAGQAASINISLLREVSKQPTARNSYVLMRSETGPGVPSTTPVALPKPDPGGYAWINFSYALQWWLAALGIFAFVLLRARREHLDSIGQFKQPKQKKVRIWDEEDL